MNKNKYEIEYVDVDGKTILMHERFRTIKQCVAIIKKLRKKEFIRIAQILISNQPGKFYLYRF